MTKDEVVKAVELLYSHWNDRLPSSDAPKKAVLRAWSDFIGDLEYQDVVTAIAGAALTDTYMPRPGQIRKAVLIQCNYRRLRLLWRRGVKFEAWLNQ